MPESTELDMLKDMLDKGGIPCILKNEQLAQALPISPFKPELWVLNDVDLPQAQALCDDWFKPAADVVGAWDCQCGQRQGGQFDSCWKCGVPRPV